MAGYADTYYEEVDALFGKLKDSAFDTLVDPAPQQEQPVGPVGWVENADASDGEAKVIIDSDGLTIIDGKLTVENGLGDTIIEDGMVREVENTGATVTIDETGITIQNGAIVLEDYAGDSVLTAYGFEGAWLGFLADGLYNSSFDYGVTATDLTAGDAGPEGHEDYKANLSTQLPGWIVGKDGTNPIQIRLMSNSEALGGFELRFDTAGGATLKQGKIVQDVPVLPGEKITVRMRWRYHASDAGGDLTRALFWDWKDADRFDMGLGSSEGLNYTDDQTDFAWLDIAIPDEVPETAKYLRLTFNFQTHGSGSANLDCIRVVKANQEGMQLITVGTSGGDSIRLEDGLIRMNGDGLYFGPTADTSVDVSLIRPSPNILQLGGGDTFDADFIAVRGRLGFTDVVSPPQITANQTDYNPTGFSGTTILRVNSDATRNIATLQAGGDGDIVLMMNTGSQQITLLHLSASGDAANRIACPGSANYALTANKSCMLVYDTTSNVWRVFGS